MNRILSTTAKNNVHRVVLVDTMEVVRAGIAAMIKAASRLDRTERFTSVHGRGRPFASIQDFFGTATNIQTDIGDDAMSGCQ